ncbi:hypothetical protein [Isoptericola variabilis]|uniref:LPXTG-motif cell wall anchor domain protein n=1 Tax=Isoptericola variabilis (strain 225) TaxID=743718 RepID=F6FSM4_ISOV2|nr:hypothetical protein [Isoptericola variabilis]AEG45186.1 hypothetical protein Isova_2475 [Isoptericola variabilis 225]TWH33999.1 hypothetical protein L600_001400000560 [Isoptericola variabilis J7]
MRRPALISAALLVTAALAGPASALSAPALPATPPGPGDAEVGERWDGGTAEHEGTTYSWPDATFSYDGQVCPDLDVPKTDVGGEQTTVTLTAPDGMLISSYCVKAGSTSRGEGPKIVVLDEPVAELEIAYPTGGKLKAISHYAVAYVAAPAQEPGDETATTTPPGTAGPEEDAPASADEPATTDEGEAPEGTDEQPVTLTPTATPAPTDGTAVDAEDVELVADTSDDAAPGVEATPGAVDAPSLAMTGAQVTTLVVAALALVAVGATTIVLVRRRGGSA